MSPNDPYIVKAAEYLLGIAFLLLFVPFWRYATGGVTAAARQPRRVRLPLLDMFHVPAGIALHPGHAWARLSATGEATLGMDDFARQLVGPLKAIHAPAIGSRVVQGQPAWTLKADSRTVNMLSPVTGEIVALNDEELRAPGANHDETYGRWLMKVRSPRLDVDAKQLLADRSARQFLGSSWDELSAMLTPELGTIMHDGGTPVNGFARGIDEGQWDTVARRFLRS